MIQNKIMEQLLEKIDNPQEFRLKLMESSFAIEGCGEVTELFEEEIADFRDKHTAKQNTYFFRNISFASLAFVLRNRCQVTEKEHEVLIKEMNNLYLKLFFTEDPSRKTNIESLFYSWWLFKSRPEHWIVVAITTLEKVKNNDKV